MTHPTNNNNNASTKKTKRLLCQLVYCGFIIFFVGFIAGGHTGTTGENYSPPAIIPTKNGNKLNIKIEKKSCSGRPVCLPVDVGTMAMRPD